MPPVLQREGPQKFLQKYGILLTICDIIIH